MNQSKDLESLNELKKQDLSIYGLQETHLKPKDIHRLKVKGWKKKFHATNRKKQELQYFYQTK